MVPQLWLQCSFPKLRTTEYCVTDKSFEKKLDIEPESSFITGEVCYHYSSLVTDVYMAYMFDRNLGGKTSQVE